MSAMEELTARAEAQMARLTQVRSNRDFTDIGMQIIASLLKAADDQVTIGVDAGDARSLVNTNGGSVLPLQPAQCPHFIADNGLVAGVPFLALRTCRTAWVKSI